MQVAFYLAGEITQVKESIPWVRCASGNVLPIYGGRGVSPQFPKSLLSKNSPKIAHLNKLKVSHKVSPIFLERGVPNRVGFVIVLVRPLLSKVWIYPGVFSLMYLIWAILFLTFHRGLRHRDKMYKSQYCILNKSLSCNFGAVRVIWWREEGFWGALCSKYFPCSVLDINTMHVALRIFSMPVVVV